MLKIHGRINIIEISGLSHISYYVASRLSHMSAAPREDKTSIFASLKFSSSLTSTVIHEAQQVTT
jgi:hypothetical protein